MTTTKDDCLFFKDKQNLVANENLNNQFLNLNLNQNYQHNVEIVKSRNFENHNKDISNSASLDFSHKTVSQTRQNFTSFGETKLRSSFANLNVQKDYGKKEESKQGKILNANSSTLSLHITAYENSIEATSGDTIDGKKDETNKKEEKTSSIKKWKAVKEILNDSSVKYAFELPRQQKAQNNDPELMQFKASQRLSNVNGSNSFNAEIEESPPLSSSLTEPQNSVKIGQQPQRSNNNVEPIPTIITIDGKEEDKSAKKADAYERDEIDLMLKKAQCENIKTEFRTRTNTKSGNQYQVKAILVREGSKFVPTKFEQCPHCNAVLSKHGGHVSRHVSDCLEKRGRKRPATHPIESYMASSFSNEEIKQATQHIGRYALKSGTSFYRCEGPELAELAVNFINMGVKRQRAISMNEFKVGRKSVKTAALKISESELQSIKPLLRAAAERGELCFSVDHGKRIDNYLSLIAHFIEDIEGGWKMRSRPIGFLRVAPDEKDYESIFKQIKEICQQMGISSYLLSKCGVVSDEGSNVVKAVKNNFERDYRCICHVSCTIVHHIFEPYKKNLLTEAEEQQLAIAKSLLDSCKVLSSAARTSKDFKLKKKPRQFIKTRFMSALWVLEDIYDSYDEIYTIGQDTSNYKDEVVNAVNMVLANKRKIEILISILKPIETAITAFEGEKYPTFHLAALFWNEEIEKAAKLKEKKDTFQHAIGAALLEAFNRKKKFISSYHLAASLLYPPSKGMMKFSETDKLEAATTLEAVCLEYEEETIALPAKSQTSKALFSSMFDSNEKMNRTFKTELNEYITSTEDFDPENESLLDWWYERREKYPRLSKAAKKLLSMPVSSTAPERSFSRARLLITDQRSRLNASTVSGLMLGGFGT